MLQLTVGPRGYPEVLGGSEGQSMSTTQPTMVALRWQVSSILATLDPFSVATAKATSRF